MVFYKNPIFLSVLAGLLTFFYMYYETKKKKEEEKKLKNRLNPDNDLDEDVKLSEIPWFIPIVVTALTWLFTELYFNSGDTDKEVKDIALRDDKSVSDASSDDGSSVTFKVPPATEVNKIYGGKNNDSIDFNIWK